MVTSAIFVTPLSIQATYSLPSPLLYYIRITFLKSFRALMAENSYY